MLEQQLIKFSHQPTDLGCNGAVPYTSQGAQLFLQSESDGTLGYSVVDPGTLEPISGLYINDWTEEQIGDYIHASIGELQSTTTLKNGMCFRLCREITNTISGESDTLDVSGGYNGYEEKRLTSIGHDSDSPCRCSLGLDLTLVTDNNLPLRGYIIITRDNGSVVYNKEIYTGVYNVLTFNDNIGSEDYHLFFSPTYEYMHQLSIGELVIVEDGSLSLDYVFENVVERQYSNVLMYHSNNEGIANIEYWCHEPDFGIPFDDEHHLAVSLPLILRNPQYKQSDEVYETLDGKSIILYSEMAKEYELLTEYIPEEWHDAIVRMLMCDEILINGINVYKSGEYSVDWDKHTKSECGTKLAMGSCKVKENVIHRNSN